MSRYEQETKKSYPLVSLVMVIILIIVVFWLFLSNQQQSEVDIQMIELPKEKLLIVANTKAMLKNIDDLAQRDNKLEVEANQGRTNKQIILPKLEESDAFFRQELSSISEGLLNWFQVKDTIKKYIVIINDLSQHQIVFKHRGFIEPPAKIVVKEDGQGLYLAKSSYIRYNNFANAIAAIDVDKAIGFYLMFKPLFEQVYQGFSYPTEYKLDDVFLKAAASVISAPIIDNRIALTPHLIRYRFTDKKLESLTDVKKQMIRMGPENTRKIQNLCRQLVQAFAGLSE